MCGGFLYFSCSLSALAPSAASAQAVAGTIIGRVTDSSGAVIPGVTVTLTNTGTKLTRVVVTDTNGEYSAPSLPTGKYTVSAEISGFKTVTMSDVELGVDQHVRIDVKLEVGALTESVTIQARIAAGADLLVRARARRSPTSRSRRCRSTGATSSV